MFSDLILYFHNIFMNAWASHVSSASWFKSSLVLIFLDFLNINFSKFYIISFSRRVLIIIFCLLTHFILFVFLLRIVIVMAKFKYVILLHCLSFSKETVILFVFLFPSDPILFLTYFLLFLYMKFISFLHFWILYLTFVY